LISDRKGCGFIHWYSSINEFIFNLLYTIPLIIVALCFHELSHGWVAYLLGDPTAKNQGRLTLNPLKHLDILGTLMMIFARFGWAKPVPINPLYFKGNRQRGTLLVALAGPVSNILLACIAGIIFAIVKAYIIKNQGITYLTDESLLAIGSFSYQSLKALTYFLYINICLASFNLIPLPPLDGSKVLASLLPQHIAVKFYEYERYTYFILLILVFTRVIEKILFPMIFTMASLLTNLLGIGDIFYYFLMVMFS
jgi:Zn-dependent protease